MYKLQILLFINNRQDRHKFSFKHTIALFPQENKAMKLVRLRAKPMACYSLYSSPGTP